MARNCPRSGTLLGRGGFSAHRAPSHAYGGYPSVDFVDTLFDHEPYDGGYGYFGTDCSDLSDPIQMSALATGFWLVIMSLCMGTLPVQARVLACLIGAVRSRKFVLRRLEAQRTPGRGKKEGGRSKTSRGDPGMFTPLSLPQELSLVIPLETS